MVRKASAAGLVPAFIVSLVLAAALLLPVTASAASTCGGYGYAGKPTAKLTATPASPQQVGLTVALTASSTGCSNPEYRFFGLAPGRTTWRMIRNYSTDATFNWITVGSPIGVYGVGVWVRQVGNTASYEAYYIGSYTLTGCSGVKLDATPPSPQAQGTTVTLTATASGCSNPEYQFYRRIPGTTAWIRIQAYSNDNTKDFNSAGATKGPTGFGVWARQIGSGSRYDTYAIITYYIT